MKSGGDYHKGQTDVFQRKLDMFIGSGRNPNYL